MGSLSIISFSLFTTMSLSTLAVQDTPVDPLPIPLQEIISEQQTISITPQPTLTPIPDSYEVHIGKYVAQSYNNCGPAALSMVLSTYGTEVSQETLRLQMRPYSNPSGGDDDKSVFPNEFVTFAEQYGYKALYRPDGDMRKLKELLANDIPIVVRTWLNPQEDISHYRIIKGYDDITQEFLQDDSYQGKDLRYTYDQVMDMWQDFNYSYILVYPIEKEKIVQAILGEDMDEEQAWRNALARAQHEYEKAPNDPYAKLNQSIAYYYLQDYKKAVTLYDEAKDGLPNRILWYQLEPLLAYQKVGNTERIFTVSDAIFYRGNKAYSELYQIRGEMYLQEGKKDLAKAEFEKALYYNEHYTPAQKALGNM